MSDFNVDDKVYLECEVKGRDRVDNTYLIRYRNWHGDEYETELVTGDILHPTDESYSKGLNDAWELVKKIVLRVSAGGYSWQELACIFGEEDCGAVLKAFTPQEALARVKAYEEEREIKVGDVVELKGTTNEAILTRVTETNICFLFRDGSCGTLHAEKVFEKTGRHYDSIDEFMRSDG